MRRRKAFGEFLGSLFPGLHLQGRSVEASVERYFAAYLSQYATTSRHLRWILKARPRLHCRCAAKSGDLPRNWGVEALTLRSVASCAFPSR